MRKMKNLKKCPFCGYNPRIGTYNDDYSDIWFIECTKCEVCIERKTKQEVIDTWNKRYDKTY